MRDRNPLDVAPSNISQYRQNSPRLICHDLEVLYAVPPVQTAKVLMARGVYKWLAVRKDLIRLKEGWKREIREIQGLITERKVRRGTKEYYELKGRMKALVECRGRVRALCHSPRWRGVEDPYDFLLW